MTKKSKAVFIVLPLLILTGVFVFLFCYNQEGFTGSRVKNPDVYLLDIRRMNGTDLHTLALHKGDALHIQFETVKGSLYMEIKAPDGTTIYRGNGKETTDFTVNIPENGVYPVVVAARHARGTIHIRREEGTYMGLGDLSLASPIWQACWIRGRTKSNQTNSRQDSIPTVWISCKEYQPEKNDEEEKETTNGTEIQRKNDFG